MAMISRNEQMQNQLRILCHLALRAGGMIRIKYSEMDPQWFQIKIEATESEFIISLLPHKLPEGKPN